MDATDKRTKRKPKISVEAAQEEIAGLVGCGATKQFDGLQFA